MHHNNIFYSHAWDATFILTFELSSHAFDTFWFSSPIRKHEIPSYLNSFFISCKRYFLLHKLGFLHRSASTRYLHTWTHFLSHARDTFFFTNYRSASMRYLHTWIRFFIPCKRYFSSQTTDPRAWDTFWLSGIVSTLAPFFRKLSKKKIPLWVEESPLIWFEIVHVWKRNFCLERR